jgi:2-keto-3-deoxy-L-rhamnonate aldolase RhmA
MFDPARSTLRARLDGGESFAVAWLSMGCVAMVEAAARARPDAVVIDLQHGLFDRRDLEAAIGAVPPEVPVLARVAENAAGAIGTALDAGAEGVIVPLVESAEEAAAAVRFARFPPHGVRSGGGVRPLADFAAYVAAAERGIVVIVMIETLRGLENAAGIAATPGVDMVFIGTGDLALCIGAGPDAGTRHAQACETIRTACEKAGVACGVFTGDLEAARARREEGYRMVVAANDVGVVSRGFREAAEALARPAREHAR